MLRSKGSFRNGRKEGARPNLHNFRSSGNGVAWRDQPVKVEATKMPMEAPIVEVIVPPKAKPKAKKAKAKK